MTGHSGGGPVRLVLRAPPHLPFVQGWPGILAGGNRAGAIAHGTVEVRIPGTQPVKAKYVSVKIVKFEAVQSGAVGKNSGQSSTTHIGKVHTLWKPQDGKEWDVLQNADYRFIIPLPADMPPTTESKNAVIRYELVATVCYKVKSGLFKKDNSATSSAVEPIRIVKYELASAWPLYNTPERRSVQAHNGQVVLTVDRPAYAFGAGDRVQATAFLRCQGPPAFHLDGFDMTLVEVVTVFPPAPDKNAPKSKKAKEPLQPIVRRNSICSTRSLVNDYLAPGMEKSARLDLVVPSDRPLLTVREALIFSVEYELVVEASCQGLNGKILISDLPCIIGSFSRSSSQQAMRDIGFVEGLCPRPPPGSGHQPTSSLPGHLLSTPDSSIRGHQSSTSLSSGLSSLKVPDSYNRPLSMTPVADPTTSPSSSQHYSPQPQQQPFIPPSQARRQPAPGFVPRELWRRSSSGTTATTATTTTAQTTDYGPLPERNASTLPARVSMPFPTPNPTTLGMSPISRTTAGSSPYTATTRENDARNSVDRLDAGFDSRPLSTATAGTFGAFADRPATVHSQTSDAAPSSPAPSSQGNWPSAADEKARLFEAARARAAKNQAAHGANLTNIGLADVPLGAPPEYTPPSSTDNTPRMSTPASSAQHGGVPSAAAVSPSPAPRAAPAPAPQAYKSAAEEKDEMRRRYEEAQSRVVSGSQLSGGGGASPSRSTGPPSFDHASASGSGSSKPPLAAYMTAAEEKELMRKRFEEAQDRVARKTGMVSPSTNSSPDMSRQAHSRSVSANYPSAAEEKDLMRRRFEEAQSRVAGSSGAGSVGGAYPSAQEEKDAMRRKFEEAQGRVARSGANASTRENGGDSMANAASVNGYRSVSGTGPQHARAASSTSGFPSAAEEKDLMRRRFEEAQNKVARAAGSPQSSTAPLGSGPPPAMSAPSQPAPYLSAAAEKDLMRKRYEEATRRVASGPGSMGHGSSSGHDEGSRSAIGVGGGGVGVESSPVLPSEEPIPYDELFGTASGEGEGDELDFTPEQPQAVNQESRDITKQQPLQTQWMSAQDEKDMMRKRFEEAQRRVGAAANSTSGSGSGSGGPARPSSPPAFHSHAEAQQQSESEAKSQSEEQTLSQLPTRGSSTGTTTATPTRGGSNSTMTSPTAAATTAATATASTTVAPDSSVTTSPGYEVPRGAVTRAGGSGGPATEGAGASVMSPGGMGAARRSATARMSLNTVPDGPPPPLPSRPPAEYITRI